MTDGVGSSIDAMGKESCGTGCLVRNCTCPCHRAIRRLHVKEWRSMSHGELVGTGLLVKELGARRVTR